MQLEWDAKETEDNLRLNFPILKDKKFTLCYRPKENAEPEPIPDPINTSQKLKQFFELLEIKPAIYLYPKVGLLIRFIQKQLFMSIILERAYSLFPVILS